jgi:hypothetical protein
MRFWGVVSHPRAPPPPLVETAEENHGGGVSDVDFDGGGWIEEVLEEGTDVDIPAAAAMTVTPPPPPHAGEKRTHEQQQGVLHEEQAAGVPAVQKLKKKRGGKEQTSQFRGVSWHKSTNKWQAIRMSKGKQTYLGEFAKEEDAARAYMEHVARNGINELTRPHKRPGSSSRFHGVCWVKRHERWVAQLYQQGALNRYLGSFRYEKEAARRYNEEARKLGLPADRLNAIDGDGDSDQRGDHDDTGGASMRSAATGKVAAAAAAATTAVAATTARPPTPAATAGTDAQSAQLREAMLAQQIKALEARAAAEDAKAALAAERLSCYSAQAARN